MLTSLQSTARTILRIRTPSRRYRAGTAGLAVAAILTAAPAAHPSPEIDPRGRLHLDTVVHAGGDDAEFDDGFHNRRARIGLGGTLDEDWDFRLEFDFAEEGVGARDLRARRDLGAGKLWLGQFKAPMSLNQLTSSNNITFIERAPAANIVPDSFRIGAAYHYFEDQFGIQTMLYGRSVGDDTAGDMPLAAGVRGVFSPAVGAGRLHVGASGAFEYFRDPTEVSFSDRPEARGADGGTRLINTGAIAGAEYLGKGGVELAFITGPLSAEAEYLALHVTRDGADSLLFGGFHVQTSFVLTGETRGYSSGTFGRPSPEHGYGAWEVAARFSHMNLDDQEIEGGVQNNVTGGVNWYVNNNLRFMLNNITSFVEGGPFDDETVNITALRLQYNF